MSARDELLRRKVGDLLPDLPTYDMPCERRVTDYTPPNEDLPYGDRVVRDCGQQPTFLLRPRTHHRRDERRLYCRDHTLRSASVWQPIVSEKKEEASG